MMGLGVVATALLEEEAGSMAAAEEEAGTTITAEEEAGTMTATEVVGRVTSPEVEAAMAAARVRMGKEMVERRAVWRSGRRILSFPFFSF